MRDRINGLLDYVKKYYWMLLSPLIVVILLLIVYALKGIYPFGDKNISYFDMSQSFVPFYYHVYDFLHFKNNLYLNWNVANSISVADFIGNNVLFPTNLFFLFVKRNHILESMSFFLIIQLSLSSLMMTIFSNKLKAEKIYAVAFGVAYASCGFAIQYYTNISIFMDTFIIFPLLMYSYYKLIEDNKKILYIVCLFFVFICNIQMAFSIVIYLLIKTFFVLRNKKEKADHIFNIFVCSLSSFSISLFYIIPCLYQFNNSSRMTVSSFNYLDILNNIGCGYQQNKNFMLFGSEFVISVFILILINKKTKKYYSNLLVVLLLALPLFFENINLIWHVGSYLCFPVRFGYILCFECIELFLISKNDINEKIKGKKIFGLLSISFIPLNAIILFYFTKYFHFFGIRDAEIYTSYWIIILLLSIFYLFALLSDSKKITKSVILVMILIQSFFGYWGFIGVESKYSPECEDDIIVNSEKIRDKGLSDLNMVFNHTKDVYNNLNANYSFITETSSGSGLTYGFSNDLFHEKIRLGYTQDFTRVLDSGGTFFSDILLGYTHAFIPVDYKYNDDIYIPEYDNEYLYKIYNSNQFGFYSRELFNNIQLEDFEYQNYLFNKIYEEEKEPLFYPIELSDSDIYIDDNNEKYLNKVLNFDRKGVLYLYSFNDTSIYTSDFIITINDNSIYAPFLYYKENVYFPNIHRNGFLEIGTFEPGEIINLKIQSNNGSFDDLKIGYMDYDKLIGFTNSNNHKYSVSNKSLKRNSIGMDIFMEEDGYVTLPIGVSDSWNVYINGKKTEIYSNLNNSLLSVYLEKGNNNVKISFKQKGLALGLIASFLGLALSIIFIPIINRYKLSLIKKIISWIYFFVFGIIIIFVNIVPVIYSIYLMIVYQISPFEILLYF